MSFRILAVGLIVVLLCGPAMGQPRVPVPSGEQLALIRKVWTLDRNFPREGTITVGIVYRRLDPESEVTKTKMLRAGSNVRGLRFVLVDMDSLGSDWRAFDGVQVVYLAPLSGLNLTSLLAATRARSIRTFTGVPEYVGRGVAVGITSEHDRTVIMVNHRAARAEGANLSSQLLKLARLVP